MQQVGVRNLNPIVNDEILYRFFKIKRVFGRTLTSDVYKINNPFETLPYTNHPTRYCRVFTYIFRVILFFRICLACLSAVFTNIFNVAFAPYRFVSRPLHRCFTKSGILNIRSNLSRQRECSLVVEDTCWLIFTLFHY